MTRVDKMLVFVFDMEAIWQTFSTTRRELVCEIEWKMPKIVSRPCLWYDAYLKKTPSWLGLMDPGKVYCTFHILFFSRSLWCFIISVFIIFHPVHDRELFKKCAYGLVFGKMFWTMFFKTSESIAFELNRSISKYWFHNCHVLERSRVRYMVSMTSNECCWISFFPIVKLSVISKIGLLCSPNFCKKRIPMFSKSIYSSQHCFDSCDELEALLYRVCSIVHLDATIFVRHRYCQTVIHFVRHESSCY